MWCQPAGFIGEHEEATVPLALFVSLWCSVPYIVLVSSPVLTPHPLDSRDPLRARTPLSTLAGHREDAREGLGWSCGLNFPLCQAWSWAQGMVIWNISDYFSPLNCWGVSPGRPPCATGSGLRKGRVEPS